jgi:hypothetical protein
MADIDKLDNAMKNVLHVLHEKAVMNNTPSFAIPHYKLGYFTAMMTAFLSQQSEETKKYFFILVDELLMNHTLNKELKMAVDNQSHDTVIH